MVEGTEVKITKILMATIFASLAFVSLPGIAAAAPPKTDARAKFYNFDEMLIDGEIKKPQALYVNPRRRAKFGKLLKLKKSFIDKLFQTAKDPIFK
jgi:hypothetical protein